MTRPSKPKLVRDWQDGYARTTSVMANGYGIIPAGAIVHITNTGPIMHLESEPCPCCGIIFKFAIKGKDKLDNLVWLGYTKPEIPNK